MSACEHCANELSCGNLSAALRVIEAMPDLDKRPRLKRAYVCVKRALEEAAWGYPGAQRPCELASHADGARIRSLTEELIRALAAHEDVERGPAVKLHQQETSHE